MALADLDDLILTHGLPRDARSRLARSIASLERFPMIGHVVAGSRFRYVLGPWPWMLVVHTHDPAIDVVTIVTIQDARRSTSVTSTRRRR